MCFRKKKTQKLSMKTGEPSSRGADNLDPASTSPILPLEDTLPSDCREGAGNSGEPPKPDTTTPQFNKAASQALEKKSGGVLKQDKQSLAPEPAARTASRPPPPSNVVPASENSVSKPILATPPAADCHSLAKILLTKAWFHGHCTTMEVGVRILKPGDFLARLTEKGDIVLTVMANDRKLNNITVIKSGEHWKVKSTTKTFGSFDNLIDYYIGRTLSRKLQLLKGIDRTKWMLVTDDLVYKEEDKLGSGHFSKVYRGKLKKTSGKLTTVAVKLVTVSEAPCDTEMIKAQLERTYSHVNIVQFYGMTSDVSPTLICHELCVGGTLLNHLITHGLRTDRREKMVYLLEAARGMEYLEQKEVVHGRLSSRCLLIAKDGTIKISNWGAAGQIRGVQRSVQDGLVRLMAPEVLCDLPLLTHHSDAWAFGVLIYEVYSNGVMPWHETTDERAKELIRAASMPNMPVGTPARIVDMVSLAWAVNPETRPSSGTMASTIMAAIERDITEKGVYPVEEMTLNRITGVHRTTYYKEQSIGSCGSEVEADSKCGP